MAACFALYRQSYLKNCNVLTADFGKKLISVIFMKRLKVDCFLFTFGGLAYAIIELLYRRKTHWSMMLTGGMCYVSIFRLYKRFSNMKLFGKCISGSLIITTYEYICGCLVNLKLKLNVWDYSKCKFNIKGQICPFYSFLWALLCIPINSTCKLIGKYTER